VRTGNYAVLTGLKAGDQVLAKPGSTLKDGQSVELLKVAAQSSPTGK